MKLKKKLKKNELIRLTQQAYDPWYESVITQ